jgi:anaerobic magnesium-protoporphyrin IX monomethyl ester cyclase
LAKVILADSPSWRLFNPKQFLHLGCLYLAGALRKAGHDVRVIDCHSVTEWDDKAQKLIMNENLPECDVLGLSATTANAHWGAQMAEAWPAKYKVLGGTHVTYILNGPHERFKKREYFPAFDYMMTNEAEESFVHFCNVIDKGKEPKKELIPLIQGLAWFDSSGTLHKNPHISDPDVKSLARPAFDLWEGGFFGGAMTVNGVDGKLDLNESMTASLYTARGCPYGCTFCADARSKVREESLEQIEQDLKQLAEMGVRCIRIQDDVFTIKKDRCRQICDLLAEYGMYFRANTRVNLTEPDLFRYMESKGCTELGFGCEHGSAKMLKIMQKGTTPEKNEEGIKMCQDAGMKAKAFLMLGHPGETRETIDEMFSWIRKVKPSMCSSCLFQPFPGCDVWNHPERYGVEIPDNAFDHMWQQGLEGTEEELVLELPTISKRELFSARQEFIQLIDSEVGHRDRRRLDTGGSLGMGTYVPMSSDAVM